MRSFFDEVLSRPAADGAAGPGVRDVGIVVVLVLAAVVEGAVRRDVSWPVATVGVTVALLSALPWRRKHPLVVAAAMAALLVGFGIAQTAAGVRPSGLITMLALLTIPYALFRWGSGRDRLVGGALLAVALVSPVVRGEDLSATVAGVVFLGGAGLVGAFRRARVALRRQELEAARAREREALARDLHDSVAHHMSAIAIRAQAARSMTYGPRESAEALSAIESEAQAVLAEMRTLLRSLRAPAERAPVAGLSELARLEDPGPPRVSVSIDLPGPVPEMITSTLFRIAQEAVTNARRHANGATRVDVVVGLEATDAVITVHDDGTAARSATAGGHGLQGMSERAALLGGLLEAGPDPSGGWMLRASVPVSGAG